MASALGIALTVSNTLAGERRPAVSPLPNHPGNIYLEGEAFSVLLPTNLPPNAVAWRMAGDTGQVEAQGSLPKGSGTSTRVLEGTKPGLGWHRVEFLDANGSVVDWTSAAVLAPLRRRPPADSPVAVDSATAWFAPNDPTNQARLANLAALAGVRWVRDRARWGQLEPADGRLAGRTTYDTAAEAQAAEGLQVLQVFHDTPKWAREEAGRGGLSGDLRYVHRFAQSMARRFPGKVQSWEPWNEPNVATFGSATMDEICAWQKAAFLGFRAGDPKLTVGFCALAAIPTPQQTEGVLANETWPYYDTYNIHTYDWHHGYFDYWAPARVAACGRPLWITEADRGLPHQKNAPWFDLTQRDEQLKAQWLPQAYASSLFAGAVRHFHFILGHYHEPNGVQFGLLRLDQTPRPAYVALAAAGRLLAGARILGHWQPVPNAHVYAFTAEPDGERRDVLVAWAERDVDWPERGKLRLAWNPPSALNPLAVADHFGRPIGTAMPTELTSAPVYIMLPKGSARHLPLTPPPKSTWVPGTPSPVVLQVIWPEDRKQRMEDRPWSESYAYSVRPGESLSIRLCAYNFGAKAVQGRVSFEALPDGWRLEVSSEPVALEPGGRIEREVRLTAPGSGAAAGDTWLRLRGEFGKAGRPVAAFRCVLPSKPAK